MSALLIRAQDQKTFTPSHAVDASARYAHVIALVPMTGKGSVDDPVRPEFVPNTRAVKAVAPVALSAADAAKPGATRPGILAWNTMITDDGKMAIVHMVAVDPHAFDAIRSDKRPNIRIFDIGKQSKAEIEAVLKLVRKDFDLQKFQVVAQ